MSGENRTAAGWAGRALIRPGVLAFAGSIGVTDRHSHHAVQVMAAHTGLTVTDDAGIQHSGTRIILPGNISHRIDGGAPRGVAVFLEPDSAAGRTAERRAREFGWTAETIAPDLTDITLERSVTTLIGDLSRTGDPERPPRHPAIGDALDLLPGLVAEGAVRTSEVAREIGLSATRLTHLFTVEVGIPLRRYILWLRLSRAIARAAAGDNLTASAHAAGFSDSAHLTRTFRETFGLPPSALSRHTDWDIAHTV